MPWSCRRRGSRRHSLREAEAPGHRPRHNLIGRFGTVSELSEAPRGTAQSPRQATATAGSCGRVNGGLSRWPVTDISISECERRESNPHPLRDRILSPARLPVPPRPRSSQSNRPRPALRAVRSARWPPPPEPSPRRSHPRSPDPDPQQAVELFAHDPIALARRHLEPLALEDGDHAATVPDDPVLL